MRRFKVTYRTVDNDIYDQIVVADRYRMKNVDTATFYQGRQKVAWFYAVKAIWEEAAE